MVVIPLFVNYLLHLVRKLPSLVWAVELQNGSLV